MKKFAALLVVLATLTLCLAACSGGGKTVYHQLQKNLYKGNDPDFEIFSEIEMLPPTEANSNNYYRIRGNVTANKQSIEIMLDKAEFQKKTNEKQSFRLTMDGKMTWHAEENLLKVEVYSYSYSTIMKTDLYAMAWTDGFSAKDNSDTYGEKAVIALSFDMNKYIENGKFVLADATVTSDADESLIWDDKAPGQADKYTVRNTNWKDEMTADILETVNQYMAELDKEIAAKGLSAK